MRGGWKTAWITGASTGIGRALALRLAAAGVRVAVSARSSEPLAELAALHANIMPFTVDVTRLDDVLATHGKIMSAFGSIDLAVLNAGVWDPMGASNYDAARSIKTMSVNYGGIANALQPLIQTMVARGEGHIALVASVAGYRGLPRAIAYAPSKAAVISLAEVLRLDLARKNIVVSLINPGFVATPMTAVNTFPMPYLMTVEAATDRIVSGLEAGTFEIAFPWQLVLSLKAMRILPYALFFRVVNRFIIDR